MASRVIVEWTRTSVRVAHADLGRQGGRLQQFVSVRLEPTSALAHVLQQAVAAHRLGGRQAIVVVPREQVITRVVKFPSTDHGELAQMAELYARGQLPYPREQLLFDFHVLQQSEGSSTVAVVACRLEVVERYLGMARAAGLSVGLVTVSSWGVLGWYRAMAKRLAAAEPTLVVHLDDSRTDLLLIGGGRLLSTRSVGQGVEDWHALGEPVEVLAAEVERSRAAIRKELPDVLAQSVVLTGVGELAAWCPLLSQRLGLPVVAADARQPLPPLRDVPAAVSPVVIGGLTLADERSLLNLSPRVLQQQVAHRRQLRELVVAGLLALAVLVAGSALLGLEVFRLRRLAAQTDALVADVGGPAKIVRERARVLQVVAAVLQERRRLTQALADILRHTPGEISLDTVTFERARQEITVRGSAASTQGVLDYLARLEQVDGMGRVRLQYSTRRVISGGERTDFELMVQPEVPPT